VLYDSSVVYLETLYNHRQRQLILRTETRAPAYATAAGKVLLAYEPALSERYGVDIALDPITEHTITTPTALAAELSQIRREGVAVNHDEYVVGFSGAAVVVNGLDGRPVAAISVGAPSGRIDLAVVMPKLRAVAYGASVAIRRGPPRRSGTRSLYDGADGRAGGPGRVAQR
jgi:IclR family transcriptional regulator, KDG regulon repressor